MCTSFLNVCHFYYLKRSLQLKYNFIIACLMCDQIQSVTIYKFSFPSAFINTIVYHKSNLRKNY